MFLELVFVRFIIHVHVRIKNTCLKTCNNMLCFTVDVFCSWGMLYMTCIWRYYISSTLHWRGSKGARVVASVLWDIGRIAVSGCYKSLNNGRPTVLGTRTYVPFFWHHICVLTNVKFWNEVVINLLLCNYHYMLLGVNIS